MFTLPDDILFCDYQVAVIATTYCSAAEEGLEEKQNCLLAECCPKKTDSLIWNGFFLVVAGVRSRGGILTYKPAYFVVAGHFFFSSVRLALACGRLLAGPLPYIILPHGVKTRD